MAKVTVIGGGCAGCAAAAAAAKAGANVTLLERAELLGGWALFAGRVDHKYVTVREELRLMGGYDIFEVLDNCTLHKAVKFPWPKPRGATKTVYDVTKLDPELRKHLEGLGVEVRVQARARDVIMDGSKIEAVILNDGTKVSSDAFVDTTGGTGGIRNCEKYGNGCAMCFQRCPAFGDRVSIAAKAGIKEMIGKKMDGSLGAVTAAFSLVKDSLAPEVKEEMERAGIIIIPLPSEFIDYKRTENITASGNIDKGFAENIVLVDIGGYAKRIAGSYTPLEELRKVPGLERALYADPSAGTTGNGIRYMAITPRGDALDVPGVDNLFVASEKLGINGVGEVTATGVMAGHNAARKAAGTAPLVLPRATMLGDFIAYVNENWDKEEWLRSRFHLFTGPYLRTAEEKEVYTEDKAVIRSRIEKNGLTDILTRKTN